MDPEGGTVTYTPKPKDMPQVIPAFDEFETVDASVDIDEHGIAEARISYYASSDSVMLALLKTGKSCPFVSDGVLSSAKFLHGSANTMEGGLWKVSLFWRGAGSALRLEEAAKLTYTPLGATVSIDTHPTFEKFAGTPAEPKNNAAYDEHNNFDRFPLHLEDGVTANPKAGVKNYYQASMKVGERKVIQQGSISSEADWFKVGKIDDPDVSNMVKFDPKLPGFGDQNRNYLMMTVKLEDIGNGYAYLDRAWDQSGPFGWDEDIYDYDDTGDASGTTS